MINALGGDVFIRTLIERWMGNSEQGKARMLEDDAMEVYMRPFRWESVVRCSCEDYGAGATVDVMMQGEDQAAGKKMDVPVLVVHSQVMGKRYEVEKVWREWMAGGREQELLTVVQTGEGIGHFVAEEDPEATVTAMTGWMDKIGIKL